ncbi:MAG: hypothetical protein HPY44_10855 [Armatimonadetes bacterium]|nr:hypothetical protein [Armatimonadota bacterium]
MPRVLVVQSSIDRERYFEPATQAFLERTADVLWNTSDKALTPDEVAERIPGCEAVITGWGGCALPPEVYQAADRLQVVGVLGGGVKAYSPELAFGRGIRILHTPRAIAKYVAEFALGLILSLCYDVAWHDRLARIENLPKPPGGGYDTPGGWLATGLGGATVGLVGLGAVGTRVVELLKPFGCRIIAHDPYLREERARALEVEPVSLEDLLRRCTILSVHAAWTPETEGMLSRERLGLLRDGAIVVNTARMPIFDQVALRDEVLSGRIKAALNLIPNDPIWHTPELSGLDNLLLSTGYATVADRTLPDMGAMMAADLNRFFTGEEPLHEVRPEMLARMT